MDDLFCLVLACDDTQALKWQRHTGQLPPGTRFDVFRGRAPTAAAAETDVYPTKLENVVRYGKGNHAEVTQA